MNAFTKEELEEFLDAIEWKLGEGQADKLTFLLQDRLKSMIENYCEHEKYNQDCYCGQLASDGTIIVECGYPPHRRNWIS